MVDIAKVDAYFVSITIDDNLVDYLDVEQRGPTLHIGLERDNTYCDITMEVRGTIPELTGLVESLS